MTHVELLVWAAAYAHKGKKYASWRVHLLRGTPNIDLGDHNRDYLYLDEILVESVFSEAMDRIPDPASRIACERCDRLVHDYAGFENKKLCVMCLHKELCIKRNVLVAIKQALGETPGQVENDFWSCGVFTNKVRQILGLEPPCPVPGCVIPLSDSIPHHHHFETPPEKP